MVVQQCERTDITELSTEKWARWEILLCIFYHNKKLEKNQLYFCILEMKLQKLKLNKQYHYSRIKNMKHLEIHLIKYIQVLHPEKSILKQIKEDLNK